jgi:hypothetical protein
VEVHTTQKDVGEENVVEAEVQPSIKVKAMAEAQQRVMEIERSESQAIVKKRRAILDRTTLLEKGIKILDPKRFMWTHTCKTRVQF